MKPEAMMKKAIRMERREHVRRCVLAKIEDVTYRILRKYGISAAPQYLPKLAEKAA